MKKMVTATFNAVIDKLPSPEHETMLPEKTSEAPENPPVESKKPRKAQKRVSI